MSTTNTVLKFAAHVGEPIDENALIHSAFMDVRRAHQEANQAAGWFFDDIFRTLLPKCAEGADSLAEVKRNLKAVGLHDVTIKLFYNSFLYASRSLEDINRVRRAEGLKDSTMSEWIETAKRLTVNHYIYD